MKTFIQKVLVVMLATFIMSLLVKGIIQVGDTTIYENDIQVLYDLDYPQAQLNNHTLREVFEGGQKLLNNNFTSSSNWTATGGSSSFSVTDGIATFTPTVQYSDLRQDIVLPISSYYIVSRLKTASATTSITLNARKVSNMTGQLSINSIATTNWQLLSGIWSLDNSENSRIRIVDNRSSAWDNILIDYIFAIDRTALGISSLTVAQMDYWFSIYQTLKALEV